jgi:hypothetical protein
MELGKRARMAAYLPILGMAMVVGCVPGMGGLVSSIEAPPAGEICQMVPTWTNEVVSLPDPTHGGNPVQGLTGRIYLFGPVVDHPPAGDGVIVVDLYDDTHRTKGQPQVPLEEWRFDKETLHRLLGKDFVGWGYSLFLPWSTYRPEITQIHLKVRYEPSKGTPLYAEGSTVTLNPGLSGSLAVTNRQASYATPTK